MEKLPRTTKVPSSEYKYSGKFPIVSQEEGLISGYWDCLEDVLKLPHPIVVFGDHTRIVKYVDFDFVIGADGVKVLSPKNFLSAKFLYYYLWWCKIPSLGYSRHYKLLKELSIPVPPLSEQERIVSELDLLTEVIDKQKAQLKELDTLAQSIFYDMFGDPLLNDKGWEIKKLGEVGTFERGGNFIKSDFAESGFPCLHYGQIHTKLGATTHRHLTCLKEEKVGKAKLASNGDLIIAITSEDVEGSCKCTAWMGDYSIAVGSHIAIYKHNFNPVFISYYFRSNKFNIEKTKYVHGFKVSEIKPKDIAEISVPLPPLSLQQSFADKVSAIEQQKAAIGRSIAETQQLFDYTMDKYFG